MPLGAWASYGHFEHEVYGLSPRCGLLISVCMPDQRPRFDTPREQIERCRALVAEIDALAQQTGGYEAQGHWLNDAVTGPVFDPGRPLRPEDISSELLATIPERSTIFSGSWLEGNELNAAGCMIWSLLKHASPVLGAKIIDRWWHRFTVSSHHYRGLPAAIAGLLADRHARRLPAYLELPRPFDGTIHDHMAVAERLGALDAARVINPLRDQRSPIVLEIGAGYGALALALKRALPHATYLIVDLPETLKLAGCYLATRQDQRVLMAPMSSTPPKQPSFLLCLATTLDRLEGLPINLAINTLSFGEMSAAEVGRYAAFLRRNLVPGGPLFEQNFDNTHVRSPNFCDPVAALAQHFKHHTPIPGMYIKGRPRVWSTQPLEDRIKHSHGTN
jgi:hypothetical protein